MNARVKSMWLKALRSGEYRQGKIALCTESKQGGDKFCCLGVLVDLYIREMQRNGEDVGWEKGSYGDNLLRFQEHDGYLPHSVVKWAGLASDNPAIGDGSGTLHSLSSMNDTGASFKAIAKIIEDQF